MTDSGCPNQQICASGPQPPDPALEIIDAAMAKIKKKILVLSGKGGGIARSCLSANRLISRKINRLYKFILAIVTGRTGGYKLGA